MPLLNHFEAWVQSGSERLEEYEVRDEQDQRVVTCWVADDNDLRRDTNSYVCWRSDGLGHPSRIRLSTERAKVNPCHPHPPHQVDRTPLTPLSLVRNGDYEAGRNTPIFDCKECAEVAAALDGKICTIKVEVFFPAARVGSGAASGSLPLNDSDVARNGVKKISPTRPSTSVTLEPLRNPQASDNEPSILPPVSTTLPSISTIIAEPFVTFYFRCRPREVLINHGIIRSRSHPLRKRTRSPSPCASDLKTELSRKRSRSVPSASNVEGSFCLGSPLIPYYDCPRTLPAPRPSYPSPGRFDMDHVGGQVNGLSLARIATSQPMLEGSPQNKKDGATDAEADADSEEEALNRIEQQLIAAHQSLVEFRILYRRKKRSARSKKPQI